MYLTIFNVFVDAVFRNWFLLVAAGAGGTDRLGGEVLHHSIFFYSYDVVVVFTDP